MRQPIAQREWQHDAGVRDEDRRPAALSNHLPVELEADEEHEEDDARLRVQTKQRHHRRRQERREQVGCHPAEQGRAEQDSTNQLADDGRLVDPLEQVAHEPGRGDDDGERYQDMNDDHRFPVTKTRLSP